MPFSQSVEELANAGIKMADITKLKEASIATIGALLATPTKASFVLQATRDRIGAAWPRVRRHPRPQSVKVFPCVQSKETMLA